MSVHDIEKDSSRPGHSSSQQSSTKSSPDVIPMHSPEDPGKSSTPQDSEVSAKPPLCPKASAIGTNNPDFEVDWDGEDDPMNPRNWPLWYKGMTIGFVSWNTWVVVVYSTSYTSGITFMMNDFDIKSEPVATLGVTTYLIGLAVGSVVLAPVSEIYGRRPVYVVSLLISMLLIIPCGLGNSLTEVVVVRFFGAIAASAMVANAPGTLTDIVNDEYRALVFSIWSIGPFNGPAFGPIIGKQAISR